MILQHSCTLEKEFLYNDVLIVTRSGGVKWYLKRNSIQFFIVIEDLENESVPLRFSAGVNSIKYQHSTTEHLSSAWSLTTSQYRDQGQGPNTCKPKSQLGL